MHTGVDLTLSLASFTLNPATAAYATIQCSASCPVKDLIQQLRAN